MVEPTIRRYRITVMMSLPKYFFQSLLHHSLTSMINNYDREVNFKCSAVLPTWEIPGNCNLLGGTAAISARSR